MGRRRGCSRQRGEWIWGKFQIWALQWTIGGEVWFTEFVMSRRNRGCFQFIDSGHAYHEFWIEIKVTVTRIFIDHRGAWEGIGPGMITGHLPPPLRCGVEIVACHGRRNGGLW
jgi:hypothetical protein